MHFSQLMVRNARRSPLRFTITVLAVAISLMAFVLLSAVSTGWRQQVQQTPNNRIVTRHKISFDHSMPIRYAQTVRALPGVQKAMGGMWAGLKIPGDRPVFFESFAVEAEPFIAMHQELVAPAEQKQAFVGNKRGAFVSAALAREFGWKRGSMVSLNSSEFGGAWTVEIEGIYESQRHGFAHRALWIHWDYFNETLAPDERDQISMISAQITDPNQGATIARDIDVHFDQLEPPTFSQEDRALNARLVGQLGAILDALNVLSLLILGVILLIVGNTVSMSVDERTKEYGALRAIGFLPRHLVALVLGESGTLGLAGGVAGLLLSYVLVEHSMSRFFEEALNVDPLQVSPAIGVTCVVVGVALGVLGASLAAYRVCRLETVDALRHIG